MVFCFCSNVGFFFFFRAKGSICHCASPPARPHRYQPLPLSRPSRDERPSPGAHACPRPPRGGAGGAEGPPRPGATPVPGRFPRRGPEPPPGGGVTCGPAAGGNGVAAAAGTPPARTRPLGAPRVLGGRLRDGGARRGGDLREPLPEGTPSSGLALLPLHLDRDFLFF